MQTKNKQKKKREKCNEKLSLKYCLQMYWSKQTPVEIQKAITDEFCCLLQKQIKIH